VRRHGARRGNAHRQRAAEHTYPFGCTAQAVEHLGAENLRQQKKVVEHRHLGLVVAEVAEREAKCREAGDAKHQDGNHQQHIAHAELRRAERHGRDGASAQYAVRSSSVARVKEDRPSPASAAEPARK
jgi:hypothetical protein